MIATALKRLFISDPTKEQAHNAYVRIIEQARQPLFYQELQVEDTLDGRFDIIVLHLFLIISRCEEEEYRPEVQQFIRILSEVFFADMDRSLREMGASDTGVGKRVQKMAQAFYGRLKIYAATVEEEDALIKALHHNVYREKPISSQALTTLASYVRRNVQALKAQSIGSLMQATFSFSS